MPSPRELHEAAAIRAAENHDIDVAVFLSLINTESKWNPNAISGDGAVGLGQIIPRWHPECENPRDPFIAVECAAEILHNHLNAFGGRYDMALAAYHNGSNAVRAFGGVVPDYEMRLYVKPILDDAAIIRAAMAPPKLVPVIAEPPATPTSATCVVVTPTPAPMMATQTPSPSPACLVTPTPTPPPVGMAALLLPLIWVALTR